MNDVKQKLIDAENIAKALFEAIGGRKLIRSGKSEKELNQEIFELAKELFGINKHWHKRIVRSGENTLFPYKENPPNKIIKDDDILFFDFGPIIEDWEADLGRTYVLGNDPQKMKIKQDIEKAWQETKVWFDQQEYLKACDLYEFVVDKANAYGWEFGGEIAGHLIGEFPHERIAKDSYQLYIHPDNKLNLFEPDAKGNKRHWILEIHFVDRKEKIGGFFEQLLT